MLHYESLFKKNEFEYCVCESRFYQVDHVLIKAKEIPFELLLTEYLMDTKSKLFHTFIQLYIKLCMNFVGVNLDLIETTSDLDIIIELYFNRGMEMKNEELD